MSNQNLIEFLQKAIQTQSLTGHEKPFIELVISEMKQLGYDRIWIDDAGNAIGEIIGSHPGKSILLDAHADTVMANSQDWDYDPFSGIIHQGRIYGRGTADTKGNLTAMIFGAAKVNRDKIFGNIYVSATVHEEVFEGGSLKVVMDQIHPDYVVIGEATDFNINHGGRGRAEIIVETIGRSAHSSSPGIGICAVHDMIHLIQTIESEKMKVHSILGPASMVLTDIISSPYPGHSVIPNRCQVTFDRRLLTDETIESVEQELSEFAKKANVECKFSILNAIETTYTNFNFEGKKFFPAWLLEENHFLVEKSFKAIKSINPDSLLSAFRFCTNAAYSAGIAGVPTIGFGLGKETDAHTLNESISINDLIKASNCFQLIIEEVLI